MNDKLCRILIVDNKPEYGAQVADRLEQIEQTHPALLRHNALQIELTNTAYFVAKTLRECPSGTAPWEIIIADVYMPLPSRFPKKEVPEESATLSRFSYREKVWPFWEYQYTWNKSLEGQLDHGGFNIARTVKDLKDQSKNLDQLKVMLMSRRLLGEDRDRLREYQTTAKDWFKYYDKADWEKHNLSGWPASQIEPDVFQWALILAIAERESEYWGDSIYEIVPDADALVGATTSSQMQSVATEARRLGTDRNIETILITGERGTGREVVARVVHEVRMKSIGLNGEFFCIDCSSIPDHQFEAELVSRLEESLDGTLLIDEVDRLPAHHQGRLYHVLKDKRIRNSRGQALDLKAQLCICTASESNLEGLKSSGLFHGDLYLLLKDEHLHIAPLRERPEDIVSLAEVVLRKHRPSVALSKDAGDWLRTRSWPGNARELMNVIKVAARKTLGSQLSAEDLERVMNRDAKPTPAVSAPSGADDSSSESEQPSGSAFNAVPPFQLHWGASALLDSQGHQVPLGEDFNRVLQAMLNREPEPRKALKTRLTYAETATAYKGEAITDPDEALRIAHSFRRNLGKNLRKYHIKPNALVKTWKGFGYQMGNGWAASPVIYHSEPAIFPVESLDSIHQGSGRKRGIVPDY